MSVQIELPGQDGQTIQTDDGFRVWEYVSSKSTSRNSPVGYWKLIVNSGGGGGGGGTGGKNYEFMSGDAIEATEDPPKNIGGVDTVRIHHDLDFGSLNRLEDL